MPGQPPVAEIRAEAERLGLAFAFVPVVSGGIDAEDVADFRAAVAELPAPVLAYCRSGTRCQTSGCWRRARMAKTPDRPTLPRDAAESRWAWPAT